jgi:hypothetical protein
VGVRRRESERGEKVQHVLNVEQGKRRKKVYNWNSNDDDDDEDEEGAPAATTTSLCETFALTRSRHVQWQAFRQQYQPAKKRKGRERAYVCILNVLLLLLPL